LPSTLYAKVIVSRNYFSNLNYTGKIFKKRQEDLERKLLISLEYEKPTGSNDHGAKDRTD
jgi:hypothetical protein